MGRQNKRKKKQKEEDFKKVKLKVGKTRAAGSNETGTSFKSRAIVIPSQESNKEGELTNVRKQSLKDLLSQLCHYSSTVRQEALLGLRSLFQQHESVLHENLGTVIESITVKVTDTDATVRHSLMLLLRLILPVIPTDRLTPFLPLVHAHLSCAMTHIFDDIQLESLSFLGLFLEHFPNQVTSNCSQLLDNFIGLITNQGSKSCGKSKGAAKPGSSNLLVDPKGKLSSQKSRLKILNQLFEFLKALYSPQLTDNRTVDFTRGSNADNSDLRLIHVKADQPTCVQIYENSARQPTTLLNNGDCMTMADASTTQDKPSSEEFLQRIVPLLLECWVECSPVEMSMSRLSSNPSSTALSIMITVMKILKTLLREQQDKSWFLTKYSKDFNHHFMAFFPFVDIPLSGKKGKVKPSDHSTDHTSVMSLNILICEVMSYFLAKSSPVSGQWQAQLEDFVVKTLKSGALNTTHVVSLLGFIDKAVHDSPTNRLSGDKLLAAVLSLYQGSHIMSATRKAVFHFFARIVVGDHGIVPHRVQVNHQDTIQLWLCSLPKLLVQLKDSNPGMTASVLRVLSSAIIINPTTIDNKILNKHLVTFFASPTGSFVHLGCEVQRSAIELLFRLDSIDNDLVQVLVGCCNHTCVSAATVQYMLQVLHCRCPLYDRLLTRQPSISLPSYLSALLTVTLGMTRKELDQLQTTACKSSRNFYELVAESIQSCPQQAAIIGSDSEWERRLVIQKTFQGHYTQCHNANKLLYLMRNSLEEILAREILPINVAGSILQLLCILIELSNAPDNIMGASSLDPSRPLIHRVTNLVLASAVYSARNPPDVPASSVPIMDDVCYLLVSFPPLLSKLLVLLHDDAIDTPEDVAMVTTKLFERTTLRQVMGQNLDLIAQLVKALTDVASLQPQVRADLIYQHTLLTTDTHGVVRMRGTNEEALR